MSDDIDKELGLTDDEETQVVPYEKKEIVRRDNLPVEEMLDDEAINGLLKDYLFVRDSAVKIIEEAQDVVQETRRMAAEIDTPRAHEVVSGAIKVTIDAIERFADVQQKMLKTIKETTKAANGGDNNDNGGNQTIINKGNMIVATTRDIIAAMRDKQKELPDE